MKPPTPQKPKKPSLAVRKRAAEILKARWDKRTSEAKPRAKGPIDPGALLNADQ